MHRLQGPFQVADNGDADVEALQTDVMRFLSIIALCLLAVFAAVSSEPPAEVTEMLDVQQAVIANLKEKLEQSEVQIEATQTRVNELESQLKETDDTESLSQAQREIRGLKAQVETLHAALSSEQQHNQKLQQQLRESANEAPTPPPVSPEVSQETPEEVIEEETEEVTEEVTEEESTPQTTTSEQQVGFTLAFQDNSALLTLLKQQRVTLYARIKEKLWEYQPRGSSFRQISEVEKFYQVNSVPESLSRSGFNQLGAGAITWGVSLDQRIQNALESIMRNNQGGKILIQETGQLELSQSN